MFLVKSFLPEIYEKYSIYAHVQDHVHKTAHVILTMCLKVVA